MKNKINSNKTVNYCALIATFFLGQILTLTTINMLPKEEIKTVKDYSNVNVTENGSINKSVLKIEDSVVYIASYNQNTMISSGTGFFYKKDETSAYLITNNHVVEGATGAKVTVASGETYEAKILGTDMYSDIAVLSVDKKAATNISKIGKSDDVNVGDTIFTMGSPLGIDYMNSVTKGIMSGKDRTIEVDLSTGSFLMEVLQIDAAINPGNSGGPLCNINGEVIGVTTLKLAEEKIEGMGFAIPIEYVMTIATQLETNKKVEKPLFGVEMLNANDTIQLYRNGIELDDTIEFGVVVVNLTKNMPAEKAGLKKGDVIIEFEGEEVKSSTTLKYLLYKEKVGNTIEIKYYRNGKILKTNVVLSESAN